MYGWRARIGLIMPANNTVMEPELYRIAPAGISLHFARLMVSGAFTTQTLVEMEKNAWRGVEELAAGGVDVLAYACLSTSLAKGIGWSETLIADIGKRTGHPATTAATATLDALKELGVKRVAVGTPYPHNINQLVKPFFESYGVAVVSSMNLNIEGLQEVCKQPPQVAYRLGRAVDTSEAEAICILATDFRTIEAIQPLEDDLGKPVVTTNQAVLWKTLRLAGVQPGLVGYGGLLK